MELTMLTFELEYFALGQSLHLIDMVSLNIGIEGKWHATSIHCNILNVYTVLDNKIRQYENDRKLLKFMGSVIFEYTLFLKSILLLILC